jgi:hypothetical protein
MENGTDIECTVLQNGKGRFEKKNSEYKQTNKQTTTAT